MYNWFYMQTNRIEKASVFFQIWFYGFHFVLGLARTGLIFTRIQEGTQPDGVTPPGQTEQGIPYHVPSCWVLVRGSWAAGIHSWLGSAQRQEQLSGLRGLCCVFSLSVSLLFLFPLFAVLLNCPYPNPLVSACFFPFSSTCQWGEGWPRGAFVASRSQTITHFLLLMPFYSICLQSVSI